MQTHLVLPGDRVIDIVDLHQQYASGVSVFDIGLKAGLDHRRILNGFHRANLPVRAKGRPRRRASNQTAKPGI